MAVFTAIDDAGSYFNTLLYEGNSNPGPGSQSITGVGFQPDFVWIKNTDQGYAPTLFDSVRGATEALETSDNGGQATDANSLTAFDADGFSLGSNEATNGDSQVSWNWKAGTTSGIAGSPSITPTSYSFNATSGFSIITYDGTGVAATLPHGLGVAPKAVIVKRLDVATDWQVYHETVGATEYLRLDDNMAPATSSTVWNDTAPTSTLFSIGDRNEVNNSSGNYVAYCFAEKQGFSKFEGYTGNGNADGVFNYTGFKPAYVMFKRTDDVESWIITDNKRDPFNPTIAYLLANRDNAGTTGVDIDFCANGFKITTTSQNEASADYVYFAFAESPLVNSEGVPTNAR